MAALVHSEPARRLGAWIVEWLSPAPEVDQLAADLSRAIKLERVRRDLTRLERLLAIDVDMSATRQLGNRLAYDWLLRELREIGELGEPGYQESAFQSWSASASPSRPAYVSSYQPHAQPVVETLEIGWRR